MSEPIFKLPWVHKIRWYERLVLFFVKTYMMTWDNDNGATYYKIWRGKVYILREIEDDQD